MTGGKRKELVPKGSYECKQWRRRQASGGIVQTIRGNDEKLDRASPRNTAKGITAYQRPLTRTGEILS